MHSGHTNLVLSNVCSSTPVLKYFIVNVFPYQNIKCLIRFSISTVFSRVSISMLMVSLFQPYILLAICLKQQDLYKSRYINVRLTLQHFMYFHFETLSKIYTRYTTFFSKNNFFLIVCFFFYLEILMLSCICLRHYFQVISATGKRQ